MSRLQTFIKEFNQEAVTTRKMLQIVPNDKYNWQPHPKSMTIKRLATHIAELPTWIGMTLNTDELDFAANPYKPEDINNTEDLMAYFGNCHKEGISELENGNEDQLDNIWTLRNGDNILSKRTKAEVLRMVFCQIVHHRAQLGVYLRQLRPKC